jgi:hypothetical protein
MEADMLVVLIVGFVALGYVLLFSQSLAAFVAAQLANILTTEVRSYIRKWARGVLREKALRMTEHGYLPIWREKFESAPQISAALLLLYIYTLDEETAMEDWTDRAVKWRDLTLWAVVDNAWWTVLVAAGLLVWGFPPSRHGAAYAFALPLLFFCGLSLSASFRERFAILYENADRRSRILVGSFSVPIVAYLALAWSLVPYSGIATAAAIETPAITARPLTVFAATMNQVEPPTVVARGRIHRTKPIRGVLERAATTRAVLAADDSAPDVPGVPVSDSLAYLIAAAVPIVPPPAALGVDALDIAVWKVPFTLQPLPFKNPPPPIVTPPPPSNVRISRPSMDD